jgi:hypothetical protein
MTDNCIPNLSNRDMFIGGHFTDLFLSGEVPDYGYPKNCLPNVGDATAEVQTGFLAAFNSEKK